MKKIALTLLALFLSSACAFDIVHVKQIPAHLECKADPSANFTLEKETKVSLGTGYSRTLKANTYWTLVGSLPEGCVFKTRDQVLTVEASNIYEAYLVVNADKLTGFYLPTEETYSPLDKPLTISVIRQ